MKADMQWKTPDTQRLLGRLSPPAGAIDMVLDTDTYNEVDDQFALCYSLLSPERLRVEAVYAAPFHNDRSTGPGDGMEKSYGEILRLLQTMDREAESFVLRGSACYLPKEGGPVGSDAARDLVARGMARPADSPLYVVAIGAATNIASALLMEPRLTEKLVVVWLGGHPLTYPTAKEFNLMQDVPAARVLFDSGVPLVLVPCLGVASHMLSTVPELTAHLAGKNSMCDALVSLFAAYSDDHFGWAKEIWDIAPIGYMINPDWVPTTLAPSPLLTDDCHWAGDARRHPIRVAYHAWRNPIFANMFRKLGGMRA